MNEQTPGEYVIGCEIRTNEPVLNKFDPLPANREWVEAVVRDLGSDRSRLLDIVQAVQRQYGWISYEARVAIAGALGMRAVEVEDTVSFYAFLNRTPKRRFQIRMSKTPVSLMKGAAEVARAFEEATDAPFGGTSQDGFFTLE
jgi:NADH:ubiquinone oxidoreductase subunit E